MSRIFKFSFLFLFLLSCRQEKLNLRCGCDEDEGDRQRLMTARVRGNVPGETARLLEDIKTLEENGEINIYGLCIESDRGDDTLYFCARDSRTSRDIQDSFPEINFDERSLGD